MAPVPGPAVCTLWEVLCHRSLPQAPDGDTPQRYWPWPLYTRVLGPRPRPRVGCCPRTSLSITTVVMLHAYRSMDFNPIWTGPSSILVEVRLSNTAVVRIASQIPSEYRKLVAISSIMDLQFFKY